MDEVLGGTLQELESVQGEIPRRDGGPQQQPRVVCMKDRVLAIRDLYAAIWTQQFTWMPYYTMRPPGLALQKSAFAFTGSFITS